MSGARSQAQISSTRSLMYITYYRIWSGCGISHFSNNIERIMDLLHDAFLRHKDLHGIEPPSELPLSSQKSIKKYAASVKSSGRDTIQSFSHIEESLSSFYHSLVGTHLSKRRYPEISRLGVPSRYHGEPTPFIRMEGSESLVVESIGTFTAAHASSLQDGTESPWLSVILYDFATPRSSVARYFNEGQRTHIFRGSSYIYNGIGSESTRRSPIETDEVQRRGICWHLGMPIYERKACADNHLS